MQNAREIIADIAIKQLLLAAALVDMWARKDPEETKDK